MTYIHFIVSVSICFSKTLVSRESLPNYTGIIGTEKPKGKNILKTFLRFQTSFDICL